MIWRLAASGKIHHNYCAHCPGINGSGIAGWDAG